MCLFRNVDIDRYRNCLLDRETLRKYQQQVNEQVFQEKNAILQEELNQKQRILYTIVVGFVFIVFIILATVGALVLLLRQNKTCEANLITQTIGQLQSHVSLLPYDTTYYVSIPLLHQKCHVSKRISNESTKLAVNYTALINDL
jgi:hypothetical protein